MNLICFCFSSACYLLYHASVVANKYVNMYYVLALLSMLSQCEWIHPNISRFVFLFLFVHGEIQKFNFTALRNYQLLYKTNGIQCILVFFRYASYKNVVRFHTRATFLLLLLNYTSGDPKHEFGIFGCHLGWAHIRGFWH